MLSVADVCRITGGRVANADTLGAAASQIRVERPAGLARSGPGELAFFFSKLYQDELATARPGILVTGEAFAGPLAGAGLPLWGRSAVVACADPYLAMALLSQELAARLSTVVHTPADRAAEAAETFGLPKIHPSAHVDPTAELGAGVEIRAGVVVSEHARIGVGSVLYPGVFVGPRVVMGERCVLFPNVTLYEQVVLGNDVRIHAGSVLGSDGFGYAPVTRPGPGGAPEVTGHRKIYHLGRVVVGDDVEIGALVTIDRGTIEDTRVDSHAKIDNQVHLGHNSRVGEGAILCGGIALAGNASVGRFAYLGGLTGVCNHVHVGERAKIAALALISKDVPPGGVAAGNPQREHGEHFRVNAWLNKSARRPERKD